MQIFKTFFVKRVFTIILVSLVATVVFALDMPDMPELTSMPEISEIKTPELDDEFYTPGIPYTPFNKRKKKLHETEDDDSETVLKEANSVDDLISSIMKNDSSTLTASDISSLYDSGLFSDFSSLSGVNPVANNATNILLKQMLTSLDELKSDQKKASASEKQMLEDYRQDSQVFKSRQPSVLRFKINGYNILDSLTTVFFSEPEFDGSFLLTADRRYFVNQKPRNETFYLLFKAEKSTGTTVIYKVQPSIVQDAKNENSFVYRLSQENSLTAEKTGNLVVMRSSGNLNIDMLLDIDKK